MLIGNIGGCIGETSALLLLIGGIYLVIRKVISPRIPATYILTVAVLTFIFAKGNNNLEFMLSHLFSEGLMLGAIFMATDYVTSPVTKRGQIIFGIGCGLLTVFIRYFGSYPEGVSYSILIMNCCVWLIDSHTKPKAFGEAAKKKKKYKYIKTGIYSICYYIRCCTCACLCKHDNKDKIAVQAQTETTNAIQGIYKDADKVRKIDIPSTIDKRISEIYEAKSQSGQLLGYAFKVAPSGYGGAIDIMGGVLPDKKVVNIKILATNSETPGLGTKVASEGFIAQFIGKTSPISVIKSGTPKDNEIMAVTGATISSKAVTTGINIACEAVAELIKLVKGGHVVKKII